ncbi:MAG: pyridoxal-phosphate dependent enzyme [Planctomycetes bacterium]|nr:pyridoxal-phosphate dependent enzyme [Planctomycetota bacterium]
MNSTPESDAPLVRMFPALRRTLPGIGTLSKVTSIVPLSNLESEFPTNRLFVKREDQSGELFGGNKVRKLELLIGFAKRSGKTTLVASAAKTSNWAAALSFYSKMFGMEAVLHLWDVPGGHENPENIRIDHLYAREVHFHRTTIGAMMRPIFDRIGETQEKRSRTWILPPGGTSPLSSIGYVNCALEIADQVAKGILPAPDFVVVPHGTGGTACGLALGFEIAGLKLEVLSVRVTEAIVSNYIVLRSLLAGTSRLLRKLSGGESRYIVPSNCRLVSDYLGEGYAQPTGKGIEAIARARDAEGFRFEPTYTGKAFAHFLDLASRVRGKTLLFVNTFNSRESVA